MKIFMKLLGAEMKKIMGKKYVFFIYVFLTAVLCLYMNFFYMDKKDSELINGQAKLFENISGPLTKEKYNFLNEELKSLNLNVDYENEEFIDDSKGAQDKGKYMPTKIADKVLIESALEQCNFILANENNRKTIINRAQDNISEYEKEKNSDNRYDIANNRLIVKTYKKQPQVYLMPSIIKTIWYSCLSYNIHSIMIFIVLIIVVSPVFSSEKEAGMQRLIYTLEKGKKDVFLIKTLAVCIIAIATTVYFEVLQLLCYKTIFPEMNGWGYPIQTVIPRCPFNITIMGFWFIKIACAAVASVLIALTISLFSIISSKTMACVGKSTMYAFIVYGVVFYQKIWSVDIVREDVQSHTLEKLDNLKNLIFTYLYYPMDYFEKFETVNFFNIPVFPIYLVIGITVFGGICIFALSYYFYAGKDNPLVA